MASATRQTVVIPMNLGHAADYDRTAYPLSEFKGKDRLGKAEYLLDATLEEIMNVLSMGNDSAQVKKFIRIAKLEYDGLKRKHGKLLVEQEPKTRNPLKLIARYRALSLFLHETTGLYVTTKRKSNELKRTINRELVSVAAQDVRSAGDDVPADANVTGIAVQLDGSVDEETTRTIVDAANMIASYADPFSGNLDLDHLCTDIASSKREPMKGDAAPASETSAPRNSSQESSPTAPRPSSSPACETPSPYCHSLDHSPFIPRPTSPASSGMSGPYRRSQASLPTTRASSPSIQNFYYFDHSFVSPKSSVYGPNLVHGGSQNSGAVNHFTTLNSAPEAD